MLVSPVFYWNYAATKQIIVNQGGTSSGKTYSILQVLFVRALESPNLVITVVGQDVPNLKAGALRDAGTIVASDEALASRIRSYNATDRRYTLDNGSIIEFRSYEDAQDAKSGKRDYLFLNEANGIAFEIFFELEMRTRKQTFIDYNPNAEFWVHKRVLRGEYSKRSQLFISTYKENPFLDSKTIESIESLRTESPELWRVYGLGLTGKITGLIFPDWKLYETAPESYKKLGFGLDFGFANDPTALVQVGLSDGELFLEEKIYQKGLLISEISDLMHALSIPRSAPIFADAADPRAIEELRRKGWNIKAAKKGADSIQVGIDIIKSHKLNISKTSKNLIEEANAYQWNKDTNKPVDAFNHAWDAVRYYAIEVLTRRSSIKATT